MSKHGLITLRPLGAGPVATKAVTSDPNGAVPAGGDVLNTVPFG